MEKRTGSRGQGAFPWFGYTIEYAAISDPGRVREENEDSFLILPPEAFFCVADGAGGHANGAQASLMTVQGVESYLRGNIHSDDDTIPLDAATNGTALTTKAIHYANSLVFHANNGGNMASTIVSCQLHQDKMLLEHVGDSRAYLLRDHRLQQLTEDHSFVYQLFRDGKISREEMRTHRFKNVITRAIGIERNVVIDSEWFAWQRDDLLLLCSDGLTSFVDDQELARQLSDRERSLADTARVLVDLANQAGGRDNITLILIQIRAGEETLRLG